jgi:hypothetical protein
MNKYEERAGQQRQSALRFSMMIWTAGAALIVLAIAILGLSSSAPPRFWSRAAIVMAILLLILRQVARRLRTRTPRGAQPDPKSRLNLD